MTYKGINFKRTIANFNDNRYPVYNEYIYYDLDDRVFTMNSVQMFEPNGQCFFLQGIKSKHIYID